jgi:sugar/nucleoside kinase (ribokinase family)
MADAANGRPEPAEPRHRSEAKGRRRSAAGPTADVLVVGDYCLDLIFTGLPQFPALGIEIVGTGFEMTGGGCYNSAVALHRLGLKIAWAADFGNDEFSRFVLERARSEGLDETFFIHHNRSLRQITVAASYPQDRAFIAFYDPGPAVPAAMKALTTASAKVLYIPGFYSGAFAGVGLRLARARGMKLVMDGNTNEQLRLSESPVRRAVKGLDMFMANAREARVLTGLDDLEHAIRTLAEISPLVVIKDGAGGAYACDGGPIVHEPAIEVKPLDTTGAGDCFNAGFLKAWLDGRPLGECLRWGNIVGGLSTLGMGGTGRVVTSKDVEDRLGV